MGLIDSPRNGATELPNSSNNSLMVFLAGPIRYWWKPGMRNSRLFRVYSNQRNAVHDRLSEDFLVYAPNLAFRGPWDSRAQYINNEAVIVSDAFVYLDAAVEMDGTLGELRLALEHNKPVFQIRCGDDYPLAPDLTKVVQELTQLRDK